MAFIQQTNIISSLGFNTLENFNNLKEMTSGIEHYSDDKKYYASKIDYAKLFHAFPIIGENSSLTRLEKLIIISINDILEKSNFEVTNRTGFILSSTKGNIDLLGANVDFPNKEKRVYLSETAKTIQDYFKLNEAPIVLSNACVSGIQAIGLAKRYLEEGIYDDIIVVGCDLFSEFVFRGFESFQAISNEPCQPYSTHRKGITLGEACGSVIVSNNRKNQDDITVMGMGTSNDANHISGPSRTGEGLFQSINRAQKDADIDLRSIDFISAHGTATNYNDEMESIAFNRLDLQETPMHSLKGYYGHTLGAAGIIEAIIGIESLKNNTLIASKGFDELGTSKPLNVIRTTQKKEIKRFLKTASGFGGCNAAVIFQKG